MAGQAFSARKVQTEICVPGVLSRCRTYLTKGIACDVVLQKEVKTFLQVHHVEVVVEEEQPSLE